MLVILSLLLEANIASIKATPNDSNVIIEIGEYSKQIDGQEIEKRMLYMIK